MVRREERSLMVAASLTRVSNDFDAFVKNLVADAHRPVVLIRELNGRRPRL